MKLRRDVMLPLGVLLLLLVIAGAAGLFAGKAEEIPPLSTNSNKPEGARALRLWLAESGYRVSNESGSRYAVPDGIEAVLILEPGIIDSITGQEWKVLDGWLEETGGILFLAARQIWRPLSSSPLDIQTSFTPLRDYSVAPVAPVFFAPPVLESAELKIQYTLVPKDTVVQPLLAVDDGLVALRIERHNGSVILVSDSGFLTNRGLKDPGNAALAINLLSLIPKGSSIWIDEWHHGERGAGGEESYGPEAWLTRTPSGFAILFAAGVIFLGLLLAGRPFGRPVPLAQDQQRRGALEYVTALANLNRRAGHRRALMQHYHTAIKRTYGRRYRMDPGLPDADYVEQLTQYNPSVDGPALLNLLRRLDGKNFTDVQVVHLAREAADWLAQVER